MGMRRLTLLALAVMGAHSVAAATATELPALASVATPDCPKNAGIREFRSETVQLDDDQALIVAGAHRQAGVCETTTLLHLGRGGKEFVFTLSSTGSEKIEIADFAPDHSALLLTREALQKFPDERLRNVQIGTLSTASGKMRWRNPWDLIGWKDCDATVQAQGFTAEGRIVIEARASDLIPARRVSCITDPTLYEADLTQGTATPLPDDTKVDRYANVTRPRSRNCASDPDLAGACFKVHGRLSRWNGGVTTRIWWIGTKRVLGVPGDIVPEAVAAHLHWKVDAYGDYRVCPLTPSKPHAMQMVCIESAEKVSYITR